MKRLETISVWLKSFFKIRLIFGHFFLSFGEKFLVELVVRVKWTFLEFGGDFFLEFRTTLFSPKLYEIRLKS